MIGLDAPVVKWINQGKDPGIGRPWDKQIALQTSGRRLDLRLTIAVCGIHTDTYVR